MKYIYKQVCGIAGIFYFNKQDAKTAGEHSEILKLLYHRGPDNQAYSEFQNCTLYHSRLSIVDISASSNQPYLSSDKKAALVFNGEIFNFKNLQNNAISDVDVLFNLLNTDNKACLNRLNGFFAFAFYRALENSLLLACDRFGVKPLYYFYDKEKFVFASELKPLLKITGKQELNPDQVYTYFSLNYCAGRESIFKNIYRMMPGEFAEIKNNRIEIKKWYEIPKREKEENKSLYELLDDSVNLRLNADVPVGTFLSGGIDSSIISALAKKRKKDISTFSIGFKNEKYFDETGYAEIVASHIKSDHHVFKLSEDDFIDNLEAFLKAIDEPFADSSAFNFYLLSKFTSKHVKVALSGDGADELFKGYIKHKATLLKSDLRYRTISRIASPMLNFASSSRNSKAGNLKRQIEKFRAIVDLNDVETFKYLARITGEQDIKHLLTQPDKKYFDELFITDNKNFEAEDLLDLKIVLAGDMLVKADRFSMQHGIEVRNPFMDYRIVEFALNLNSSEKINKEQQKIILKKEFSNLLPPEIFDRSKKGFELPLQKWLSGTLNRKINTEWLNEDKIRQEGILNYDQIKKLKLEMSSKNPGDSAAKLWAIIVFENWLNNFKDFIK